MQRYEQRLDNYTSELYTSTIQYIDEQEESRLPT